MTFTDYCAKEGIQLLPDDLRFIRRCLGNIPKPQQKAVMRRYVQIWIDGARDEENPVKKQNCGRNKANSYLIEMF